MDLLPLRKGIFPHLGEKNDENDVVITKRALERLGYQHNSASGPTCFADQEFLNGLRRFQKDQGLNVDAIVTPGGPTGFAIGKLLEGLAPLVGLPAKSAKPSKAQCDHLYYNVDMPMCNAIARSRGKARGVHCRMTAADRYARCLAGTPIADLPQLDTWNN
jgi:hypothetical protein